MSRNPHVSKIARDIAVFVIKLALTLAAFFGLSAWHLSIIDEASANRNVPYTLVHVVTSLLSSPSWDAVAVPINLFFDFGIWPGAVVAAAVAIVWRTDTALQICAPILFAALYLYMNTHGSLAFSEIVSDFATGLVMFVLACIPFTIAGRELNLWFHVKTDRSIRGG